MDGVYRPPTNFELAAGADTIVLGTVERVEEGEGMWGTVIVRPTLLLKGAALPAEVRLRGDLPGRGHSATRSDPLELSRPNPHVFSGACSRYVFEPGMQLVLFLERNSKGELQPSNPPFSRAAEDVPGPDALWVKAVRLYAEISGLPAGRRRAALLARRAALLSYGEPDAAVLAADIDRQVEEVDKRRWQDEMDALYELITTTVPLFDGKPFRIAR
jgi:hypothetical protein